MSHPFRPLSVRIKDKFEIDLLTECWNWIGAMASSGYGKIGAGGHSGRTLSAHRVAWEIEHGQPVPNGLQVLHRCDNKKCVNPKHLFVGTQKDNLIDCLLKGRSSAKLDPDKVIQIRTLNSKGVSNLTLTQLFGVHNSTIQRVVTGERWGFVKCS